MFIVFICNYTPDVTLKIALIYRTCATTPKQVGTMSILPHLTEEK